MVSIEFQFNQIPTIIQSNLEESFQNAINKFIEKTSINPDSVCFLANGKNINPELTIESQMNELNKKNKNIQILVHSFGDENQNKEEIIVKAKDIICPYCGEPCRFKIEGYKVILYDCANNHLFNNIKINEFFKTQQINLSNIKCQQCLSKNKGNTTKNEFYRCLTCKKNLCILCKSYHDQKHNIIEYDNKNYICPKHNEPLIKYCKNCHSNFCFSCDDEHQRHNTISLLDLKPNISEANKKLSELKKEIDTIKGDIAIIIKQLTELNKTMDIFYEINSDIVNNYEIKNRNYQLLENINEINIKNDIFNDIKKINSIDNFSNKLVNILELYDKINSDNNQINQMTITYKINKDMIQLKLFGDSFVQNNKNNCYLLIDGKKYDLCEEYTLNKKQKEKNTLEVKLIETKPITNMYRLFYYCICLLQVKDFDKWDTKNVTTMRSLFNECPMLKSIPDISKWNTKNVIDMKNMFYDCYVLESIPDISKWDMKNVKDVSQMFFNCKSLKSFPDFSKWKNNKELKTNKMFFGCNEKIIPKGF